MNYDINGVVSIDTMGVYDNSLLSEEEQETLNEIKGLTEDLVNKGILRIEGGFNVILQRYNVRDTEILKDVCDVLRDFKADIDNTDDKAGVDLSGYVSKLKALGISAYVCVITDLVDGEEVVTDVNLLISA
jgi:hypothetical protein